MPNKPALSELNPRRIVLIKPSALGDIVHSLPVLGALRRRFPDAHITWMVNGVYEPLLRRHPDLNATLPFERGAARRGWFAGIQRAGAFYRRLRAEQFDLAIDLQGLFRSGVLSLATGAKRRIGLSSAREGARFFYTDIVTEPGRLVGHAVDRYWCVAKALGADAKGIQFHLPIESEAATWAEEQLRELPRPWMIFGVGSRWQTKRWLPEHFTSVARYAQSTYGGSIIFIGTPDEAELSATVREQLRGPSLDVTGKTTLPQLTAILGRADVMVANDTGPLHMAVALGRPVVSPYTCTRAALTGPYGQLSRTIETTVHCAGSLRKRCSRMECMTELTPDRLRPALDEVLRPWQCKSRLVS